MKLRNLILISNLLFMLAVILVNGWQLNHLTDQVKQKLGESAFAVSKSTVEHMLENNVNFQLFGTSTTTIDSTLNNRRLELLNRQELTQAVELSLANNQTSNVIQLVRGNRVFGVPIPRTEVDEVLKKVNSDLILISSVIVISSIAFFFILSRYLTAPLNKIITTSQLIGKGQFGITVDKNVGFASSEFKELTQSINSMSGHLVDLEQTKERLQEQRTTSEISDITRGLAHSIRNPL
ncbi:MAG: HAMP domain-containing protein, partial [Kangiellaceae bacterium]|nr:HAMP domain-containing protein [Kangiellaceae bacterium]